MDEAERLGVPVPGWTPPRRPDWQRIEGRYVALERLDPLRHAADLHAANRQSDAIWDYLPYGPFADEAEYRAWAEGMAGRAGRRALRATCASIPRPAPSRSATSTLPRPSSRRALRPRRCT